ncbi:ABC transporter permease [Blautia ammoniilytica]|uniref:ABC transporter permease n=1 Tax=Blautia ammoniilytica TaxID=2981782 RepID=A0ABT2TZD1_9FIRM|nr:ABC transporter permease [Blautia ammoniilytica]MCU6766952.1 ABC transporter permease [Blautia ammoniilytica]SCI93757.1 Ribose transport system permease protein rbsC [uncultured Blautia sp.]
MLAEYAIIVIFIVLFVVMSIFAPNFFTGNNMVNILRQVSISGICAVGMTFVMLTGGIDLSVGAILGVSGVLTAMMMLKGIPSLLASIIALALGVVIGGITGAIIHYIEIPPMIATLGTMTSLRGVAYLITGGTPVFGFDESYSKIGQGHVGVIPIPVIILAIVYVIGIFVLSKTKFSRYVYGIGGNQEVARLSGIKVARVKIAVYAISGFCSALAGLVMLGRVNSGQPRAGESYEMDVITAVVLGGVSLNGGVGNLSHVIFGVLIIGVLTNGMTMMAVDDYWQRVVKGLILLLAVSFDHYIQKKNIGRK